MLRPILSCSLAAFVAVGCATTGGGDGGGGGNAPSQFPTRDAIDKIAEAPSPTKLTSDPGIPADGWPLSGPLPDAIEPVQYSDGSPWQALLEEAAAARSGLVALPMSMHCVAQEEGMFFLAKRALPAERLSRFIAARCGAVASDVRVAYLEITAPPGTTHEQIVEHFRPQLLEQARALFSGGPQIAGIWFGQRAGRAVVMLGVATRRANLDRLPLVPGADGTVTITGELLQPAEHLEAVFNRGHFGFGRCVTDPRVVLPRFSVSCAVDATDADAWIEVAAFPAGRVLGHVVASLVVFPSGTPSAAYHEAGYVTRSVPVGPDARAQLLALINEVRRGAGLPEVTLAARESAVAEKVAPHYFAAIAGGEPEIVADQVVLGVRAGWDVDGDVLDGRFTAGAVVKTDDLGRLLDAVLERPSGREALLGHAVRQVALGPVVAREQELLAMVAGSYVFFEGAHHDADAQRVLGRLTKARVDHQMAPPQKLADVQSVAQDAAARVQSGQSSPTQALKRMLQRSVEAVPGLGFRGWVFEVGSIDELTFPVELVRQPIGGVAISVCHYRPKNGPWSRLVVFVLAAGTTDQMMRASR